MKIFPAIDIKDKKCVRLIKGDFENKTEYDLSPIEQAGKYKDYGFKNLHIVDLDGALTGDPINIDIIHDIVGKFDLKIEIGGGIRNINDIDFWLQKSVDRVILGTLAIDNPKLINQLDSKYFKKIIIGTDVRDGKVATNGWKKQSDVMAVDLIKSFKSSVVNSIIYTDISKDGSLKGVSLNQTRLFAKSIPHPVIASGGVGSIEDIAKLKIDRNYQLDKPKGVRGRSSNNDLVRKKIGWDKKINLKQGLKLTFDWIHSEITSGTNSDRFIRKY